MDNLFKQLGTKAIHSINALGKITILIFQTVTFTFKKPFSFKNLFDMMVRIGFDSLPVVIVTALATGMVLALQTGVTLEKKLAGTATFIGGVVGLSVVRELGPTLTALMVTGRIGSAIAAEIGTMKVTEQIDALVTLSANPVQYLVVPRFLAALFMFPVLTMIADIVGIIGGGIITTTMFDPTIYSYINQTQIFVQLNDIAGGIIKSVVFGGLMAIISCYQGFNTYGGAEGVGKATTTAVVISSLSIIISDIFLNMFIIKLL